MIQGFNHYNLRVPALLLEPLKDFYCDVVGLTIGQRPPLRSHGYWLYAGGKALLHLSQAAPEEGRNPQAVNTFDHAAFSCTELVAMEQKLIALGVEFRKVIIPVSGTMQLFLRDPAGNGVELNFENADI